MGSHSEGFDWNCFLVAMRQPSWWQSSRFVAWGRKMGLSEYEVYRTIPYPCTRYIPLTQFYKILLITRIRRIIGSDRPLLWDGFATRSNVFNFLSWLSSYPDFCWWSSHFWLFPRYCWWGFSLLLVRFAEIIQLAAGRRNSARQRRNSTHEVTLNTEMSMLPPISQQNRHGRV